MDRMTEYIVRAAHELGLQITAPFCCHLGDAMEVVAVAYLPELGGTNGTLIFRSNQYDRTTFGVLQSRGSPAHHSMILLSRSNTTSRATWTCLSIGGGRWTSTTPRAG